MSRERFFELLEKPYTPYVVVELVYVIATIVFYIKLANINRLLNQNFDVDRMVTQKDVAIATDVMAFRNNSPWDYLLWGMTLILISIAIPIVFFLINKSSYRKEEDKATIWMVIMVIFVINLIIAISLAKALFSPIIIAVFLIYAIGGLAIIGSSQS